MHPLKTQAIRGLLMPQDSQMEYRRPGKLYPRVIVIQSYAARTSFRLIGIQAEQRSYNTRCLHPPSATLSNRGSRSYRSSVVRKFPTPSLP